MQTRHDATPIGRTRSAEDATLCPTLARFRRRPPVSALPVGLRRAVRAFFGTIAAGRRRAEDPRGGAPG